MAFSLLFSLIFSFLVSCDLPNPLDKNTPETMLQLDYSKTDTSLYDSILFYGVAEDASDTIFLYKWQKGKELKTKVELPDRLGDNFDLIIKGKKNGKTINAKSLHLDIKNPSSEPDYTPRPGLLEINSPIIDTIKDVESTEGETVTIRPSVSAEGLYDYLWFKGDSLLLEDDTLTIEEFSKEKEGDFTLKLVNRADRADTTLSNPFNIQFIEEAVPITIQQDLDSFYSANAYGELILGVGVQGTNPKYQWYRNGEALAGERRERLKFKKPDSSLEGKYYVSLSNSLTKALKSKTARVAVVYSAIEITLEHNRGGEITPAGHGNIVLVRKGESQEFKFKPDSGFSLDSVFINGEFTPTTVEKRSTVFQDVDEPHRVRAVFTAIEYQLRICVDDAIHGVIKSTDLFLNIEKKGVCFLSKQKYGDSILVNTEPFKGFKFELWEQYDGLSEFDLHDDSSGYLLRIKDSTELTAVFKPIEYVINVTANDGNEVLKDPDTAQYAFGTMLKLKPKPRPGFLHKGWNLKDSLYTDSVLTVKVDGVMIIDAVFEKISYPVIVKSNDTVWGTVSIDPDTSSFHYGDTVTVKADSRFGYQFSKWEGIDSASANFSFTVTKPETLTALFSPFDKFTLAVDSVPGNLINVTPRDSFYTLGDTVTLTAYPGTGFLFREWLINDTSFTDSSYQLIIRGHNKVKGVFNRKRLKVNFITRPSGTGDPALDTGFAEWGRPARISANPASGFDFRQWIVVSGPGEVVIADSSQEKTQITVEKDSVGLMAYYVREQYNINYILEGGGSVINAPKKGYYLDRIVITARPDSTHQLVQWELVEGEAQLNNQFATSLVVILTGGDITLKPVFEALP